MLRKTVRSLKSPTGAFIVSLCSTNAKLLQYIVIQTDILIGSIFHQKAIGNRSHQHEAKTFIQVPGMNIVFYYGIELHQLESMFFCLIQTVGNQPFANVFSPVARINGRACICNMTATTNIVRVKNVKSNNCSVVVRDGTVCLCSKKYLSTFFIKKIQLWKSNTFLNNLVPNTHHSRHIGFTIVSDFHTILSPTISELSN